MNKIYIIFIESGFYDTYITQPMFVTSDLSKAEKWVDRYNNIVKNSTNRFEKNKLKYENTYNPPYLYDFIMKERPYAYITTSEIR